MLDLHLCAGVAAFHEPTFPTVGSLGPRVYQEPEANRAKPVSRVTTEIVVN